MPTVGARRAPGHYVVEPDGSLDPDDGDDTGLEFVSPPLPLSELLSDLDKVKKWADKHGCYTNDSTGLHINVSVPNFSLQSLDYVKLALLLGDKYILDQYGRSTNTYCKSALDKVKAAGILPLGNGSGYAPGMEQLWGAVGPTWYGGNDFYKQVVAGNKTFTDKNFVASLQAVKDLVAYFPAGHEGLDYNTARGLFANEKAAFYIGGNYEISYFRSLNPSLNVGWMPAPAKSTGEKRYVTNWADGGFAINAKTTHKAEAIKFMNFLASKAFMQAAADTLGWIPTISGIKVTDPAVISMQRAIPSSGTPFLTLVGFRYGTPTSSSIMQPGFQKVATGAQTPTDLAKAIQTGVSSWYKPQAGKA